MTSLAVGLLAAATNIVKHADRTSTVLKYNEPPEARKPAEGWRIYVFKGKEQVGAFQFVIEHDALGSLILSLSAFLSDLLHIYRQSAYLTGRDKAVADIHTEHPSCSKQHAAFQFRQVKLRNEFGDSNLLVKFAVDLATSMHSL